MAQVVAALAVQIRAVVERVHLMDPHAGQPAVLALEHVEQGHRLAVRHRHHDVGVARDVVENRFGRRGIHAATIAGFPQRSLRPTADWSRGSSDGRRRSRTSMRLDPSAETRG